MRIDRRMSRNLGLLLASLAFCGLAAEMLVRWAMPQPLIRFPSGLFEPDPPRRYRLVPGSQGTLSTDGEFSHSVSINSLGMRGPEIDRKEPGTHRILSVGDSFTFGHGVEVDQSFAARLQQILRPSFPKLETLNGGVPGFGLPDALGWLRQYGLPLKPDLVLINICLANDLLDATEDQVRAEMFFDIPEAADHHGLVRFWLFRNSHIYRLVGRAMPTKLRSTLGLSESWIVTYLRDMVTMHTDNPSALALKGRRASRDALAGFSDLSEQHGFQLAAMFIPNNFHLEPDRWSGLVRYTGLDPADYDAGSPQRFFQEVLSELSIPLLDLSPVIGSTLRNGEKIYYDFDPHWTPEGHLLAANSLSAFILKENLLPKPGGAVAQISDVQTVAFPTLSPR